MRAWNSNFGLTPSSPNLNSNKYTWKGIRQKIKSYPRLITSLGPMFEAAHYKSSHIVEEESYVKWVYSMKAPCHAVIYNCGLVFCARMLISVALSAEGTDSPAKELACEDCSCHMSKPLLMPVPPMYALPHLGDGVCRAYYLTLISRSGWVGEKTSDALGANSARCRRNPEDCSPI